MSRYRYITVDGMLPERPNTWLALDTIQDEILAWEGRNFGDVGIEDPKDGMVEEIGELHHHILKQRQGIRGTWDEHEAKQKDSIGDLAVYIMSFCGKKGWRLSDIIEETWLEVQKRDWTKNKEKGVTATSSISQEDREYAEAYRALLRRGEIPEGRPGTPRDSMS